MLYKDHPNLPCSIEEWPHGLIYILGYTARSNSFLKIHSVIANVILGLYFVFNSMQLLTYKSDHLMHLVLQFQQIIIMSFKLMVRDQITTSLGRWISLPNTNLASVTLTLFHSETSHEKLWYPLIPLSLVFINYLVNHSSILLNLYTISSDWGSRGVVSILWILKKQHNSWEAHTKNFSWSICISSGTLCQEQTLITNAFATVVISWFKMAYKSTHFVK